jgi:hypothetical protein
MQCHVPPAPRHALRHPDLHGDGRRPGHARRARRYGATLRPNPARRSGALGHLLQRPNVRRSCSLPTARGWFPHAAGHPHLLLDPDDANAHPRQNAPPMTTQRAGGSIPQPPVGKDIIGMKATSRVRKRSLFGPTTTTVLRC